MKAIKITLLLSLLGLFVSCASNTGIFPKVDLSTAESDAIYPNPISVAVDETNGQIVVVNSNVDMLFDQGSLAVLSVDASATTAPTLTAQVVISAPNFGGENYYDGAGNLYIPFREASTSKKDTFKKYSLTAARLVESATGTVTPDPFGIAGAGGQLYVVSDEVLEIYDTALSLTVSVDLETAAEAGISDSASIDVLSVAVDTTLNLAIVSNPGGRIFVVDLLTNKLRQAIDGPESSRDVWIDSNDILYASDYITGAVWVFDLNNLPAPATTPDSVDDSRFLLAAIGVGTNPGSLVLDTVRDRLYVSNFNDDSISIVDTIAYQELMRISLDIDDLPATYLRDCDGPYGLGMGDFNATSYLFVACFYSHDVMMINLETLRPVAVYPNTK